MRGHAPRAEAERKRAPSPILPSLRAPRAAAAAAPRSRLSQLRTDIRGGADTWLGWLVESLIGLFNPSLEAYAARTVSLLFAPGLDKHSGAMFGQGGGAILPNVEFLGANGKGRAKAWFDAMEALLGEKGVPPGPPGWAAGGR